MCFVYHTDREKVHSICASQSDAKQLAKSVKHLHLSSNEYSPRPGYAIAQVVLCVHSPAGKRSQVRTHDFVYGGPGHTPVKMFKLKLDEMHFYAFWKEY